MQPTRVSAARHCAPQVRRARTPARAPRQRQGARGTRYEAAFAPDGLRRQFELLKRRKPLHTSWYSCARIERPPFRVGHAGVGRGSSPSLPRPSVRPVVSIHASAWATPCSQPPRPMLRRHRVNGRDGSSVARIFGGGDKVRWGCFGAEPSCPGSNRIAWRVGEADWRIHNRNLSSYRRCLGYSVATSDSPRADVHDRIWMAVLRAIAVILS